MSVAKVARDENFKKLYYILIRTNKLMTTFAKKTTFYDGDFRSCFASSSANTALGRIDYKSDINNIFCIYNFGQSNGREVNVRT